MIHQPSMWGLGGQASDIQIWAKEILDLKDILADILSASTGQTKEKILADADRDFTMRPEAALEYGIIDKIVVSQRKEEDDDE